MVQIIPVINVKTGKKFKERLHLLHLLSDFSGFFQIDVADGHFTPWKNWNAPAELKKIKKIQEQFELHLMVHNPEVVLPLWLETKPKRIIVHLETIKNFSLIEKMCREAKVELGLAIKPDTPIEKLNDYLKNLNFVLVLGVFPGPSGQKFQWYVLDKIKELRRKYPKLNIEIDGGVNEETILKAIENGANILAIGSAIFEDKNQKERIKYFKEIINSK